MPVKYARNWWLDLQISLRSGCEKHYKIYYQVPHWQSQLICPQSKKGITSLAFILIQPPPPKGGADRKWGTLTEVTMAWSPAQLPCPPLNFILQHTQCPTHLLLSRHIKLFNASITLHRLGPWLAVLSVPPLKVSAFL